MEEMLIFIEESEKVMEILNYVVAKVEEEEISDFMKESMMSMLFDVLFKEKSVETAEMVLNAVKEVNAEMGYFE